MMASESADGKKWPGDDDLMKEQLLKRTTDVKWAIDHLLFRACHVADSAYSVGQALLNDDGYKIGSQEASKNNYKTRYLTAYASVQYLQMAQKYYQSKVDEKKEYSKLQITIQDPQIWAPKSYFKGSVYSDIENTSGIDFAWSWSARSACQLTSSCKNLFIVTEKDCPRSVVVLDFMTDGKISEAKTTSKEYSLKAGEISLIEAESKFSTSATTLNLRSFKCISQQVSISYSSSNSSVNRINSLIDFTSKVHLLQASE